MRDNLAQTAQRPVQHALVVAGILTLMAVLLLAPVQAIGLVAEQTPATAPAAALLLTPTPTATRSPSPTPSPTASSTPTIDVGSAIPIACGQSMTGDTGSATNRVATYGCAPWWPESGPEKVYALTLANSRTVDAVISGMTVDLDVFVLTSANPESCIAYGDNFAHLNNLSPGRYYIVVDGFQGAAGEYRLNVWCPLVLTPTVTPTATPTVTPSAAVRRIYLPLGLKN